MKRLSFLFYVVCLLIPINAISDSSEIATQLPSAGHIAEASQGFNESLQPPSASFNSISLPKHKASLILNAESIKLLLKTSHQFKTVKELIEDLETWEAPEEFRKNYPYYLSGYDDEERPIWIAEVGQWNLRKIVESGRETLETFDKYARQIIYRVIKSLNNKVSEDDVYPEMIFVADFDQLSMHQLAHAPTVAYLLQLARDMEPVLYKHTSVGYILNANYVTQWLLELVKPIIGSFFDRIEVYGTNKAKWIPRLLTHLPKSQIPPWYGGSREFKPLAVYG